MPPRTRAALTNPIVATRFWCMHCMRTEVGGFEPNLDLALRIECILDAKSSILCQQCSARGTTCLLPATGVLGDAHDLSTILKWAAAEFWPAMDNVDGLEEWPLTVRLEVAGSSKDLCKSFDAMEMAHRKYHDLTGSKGESKKAGPSYNAFLATRRQELAGILPPAQNASAEAWAEFRSKKLLRTLPGDEGFVAWLQAKASFLERIVVVAREWGDAIDEVEGADGDGDSDGNSREASADYFERILRGDFPLELEEI